MADLFNSPAFQDNLLPHLEKLSIVPYVQPRQDQSDDDYMFELRNANLKAGAYSELLAFLKSQPAAVERITKELEVINKKEELENGQTTTTTR